MPSSGLSRDKDLSHCERENVFSVRAACYWSGGDILSKKFFTTCYSFKCLTKFILVMPLYGIF